MGRKKQRCCSRSCANTGANNPAYTGKFNSREYKKSWRLANIEHVKEYFKTYRKHYRKLPRVKLYNKKYNKQWRDKNADRIRDYAKQYTSNRYKTDIQYRLRVIYRSMIRQKLNGLNKQQHSVEYLGCSFAEYEKHIESQFQPGMSWSNYGRHGWHVDHIIPCAYFDFTKEEDIKRCFHYTNLQPLWAEDNYAKGDKLLNGLSSKYINN